MVLLLQIEERESDHKKEKRNRQVHVLSLHTNVGSKRVGTDQGTCCPDIKQGYVAVTVFLV